MSNEPKKHNRPWSHQDIKRLRKCAADKMSAPRAGRVLGRTTGSVKYKAMVEGIRFHYIEQPPGVQARIQRARRQHKRAAIAA